MTPALTALLALGATISFLFSLAAIGIAIFALMRPQRDQERLLRKVQDLATLRVEWENTLAALDVMNKRAARLARKESENPGERKQGEDPRPEEFRRDLTRTEVLKMALAKRKEQAS